jgi:hypothetical protein
MRWLRRHQVSYELGTEVINFIWTCHLKVLMKNLPVFVTQARHCLFKPSVSPSTQEQEDTVSLGALETLRSFKRPDPPCDIGHLQSKRRKSSSLHAIRETVLTSTSPSLQRSFSETEATIKKALQRCEYLSLSQPHSFYHHLTRLAEYCI